MASRTAKPALKGPSLVLNESLVDLVCSRQVRPSGSALVLSSRSHFPQSLTRRAFPLCPMSKSAMQPSPTADIVPGGINGREHFWVKHYTWLEDCGYKLRPRYAPDWIPSWIGTNKLLDLFEDGKTIFVRAKSFRYQLLYLSAESDRYAWPD